MLSDIVVPIQITLFFFSQVSDRKKENRAKVKTITITVTNFHVKLAKLYVCISMCVTSIPSFIEITPGMMPVHIRITFCHDDTQTHMNIFTYYIFTK